jgi:uncharacterized protein (TIGR02145 family)
MKKYLVIFSCVVLTTSQSFSQILDTIKIGSQVWMAKSLNTYRYANGDSIPFIKTWDAKQNAYGEIEYYELRNKQSQIFGSWQFNKLGDTSERSYNWLAVTDSRGLCPNGWHVPSIEEYSSASSKIVELMKNKKAMEKEKKRIDQMPDSVTIYHDASYKTEDYFEKIPAYRSSVRCPNCSSWTEEYARKVPCHKCKDSRRIPGPLIPEKTEKRQRTVLEKAAWKERVKNTKPEQPIIPVVPELFSGTWWTTSSCDDYQRDGLSESARVTHSEDNITPWIRMDGRGRSYWGNCKSIKESFTVRCIKGSEIDSSYRRKKTQFAIYIRPAGDFEYDWKKNESGKPVLPQPDTFQFVQDIPSTGRGSYSERNIIEVSSNQVIIFETPKEQELSENESKRANQIGEVLNKKRVWAWKDGNIILAISDNNGVTTELSGLSYNKVLEIFKNIKGIRCVKIQTADGSVKIVKFELEECIQYF